MQEQDEIVVREECVQIRVCVSESYSWNQNILFAESIWNVWIWKEAYSYNPLTKSYNMYTNIFYQALINREVMHEPVYTICFNSNMVYRQPWYCCLSSCYIHARFTEPRPRYLNLTSISLISYKALSSLVDPRFIPFYSLLFFWFIICNFVYIPFCFIRFY